MCVAPRIYSFSLLILAAWQVQTSFTRHCSDTSCRLTTLNFLRQYTLRVLFVPPAPLQQRARQHRGTSAEPVSIRPQTEYTDPDRIIVPAGLGQLEKDCVTASKHEEK